MAGTINNGSGTNAFNNAGTFQTSFASGTTTIGVTFNNTGSVQVGTGGTLNLSGGGTSTGGSFTGGGTLQFGGGTYTLDAASTISTANAIFSAGTTTLAGTYSATNTTLSGGALTTGSSPITLGTNFTHAAGTLSGSGTVTVTGLSSFTGVSTYMLETGSGTTDLQGGGVLSSGILALDGGRKLQNEGIFNWTGGSISLGQNPFGTSVGGATIVNALGATFNDAVAGTINNGSGTNAFINAGTFQTSFASGTTTIAVTFNNTGTVNVQSGTLAFTGAFSNSES